MRLSVYVSLLGALLAAALPALATELVTNPNTARAWTFDVGAGAAATIREEGGGLRFDITRVNGQTWGVQAYQPGKHARDGAQFTLRLKAKASTNRTMLANCQIDKAPWRPVVASPQTINLTTQWQTYSFPLTFRDVRSDTLIVPQFMFGDVTGTVWIKDVSVSDGPAPRFNTAQQATTSPSSPAAAPTTAPVPASASATEILSDPTNTANWHFDVQPDARATFTSEAGVLRVDVQQASTERWHVQFYQVPETIVAGSYTCAITVRSTSPRKLSFMVQHHTEPWEKLIAFTELPAGPEWKEYKIRFTLTKSFPGETRAPMFDLGDTAGTVYFRSISLIRTPADSK